MVAAERRAANLAAQPFTVLSPDERADLVHLLEAAHQAWRRSHSGAS
jgi:hypothetical protein